MNENAASKKCDIVASIETVPECTKEKHCHTSMYAVIDHKTQPVSCRPIPVVKQHFQACAELKYCKNNKSCAISQASKTQIKQHDQQMPLLVVQMHTSLC